MNKKILFINSYNEACGVYQYGLRTAKILKKSSTHQFIYVEISEIGKFKDCLEKYNPDAIIYNNHGPIMPWLSPTLIRSLTQIKHIGIHHEGNAAFSFGYNFLISQDPTIEESTTFFSVPRPLIEYKKISEKKMSETTTINSFGFSFNDKGFKKVVDLVCDQYDEAIINLHMPSAHFDRPKEETTKVISDCQNSITKKGVKLNITRSFLPENELLDFLASGDINIFPYDLAHGRGISSVIDYALSVDRPIGISKSYMFRHIIGTNPSICIEDRPIREIIESGIEPLNIYKIKWSNDKLLEKYCTIIDKLFI